MKISNRFKRARKTLRRNRTDAAIIASALLLAGFIVLLPRSEPKHVDPAAYKPLLDTIAKGESKGNYNAYFGHAGNKKIQFTEMSVAEVMKWQENHVAKGSISSAVGKYQIIRPTLAGLVTQMKINTALPFDPAMQDRMAIALLERRGAVDYMNNKISREQFAANLAKEWAALPKASGKNPNQSHYAGDGVNKSNISVNEVFSALAKLQGWKS